MHFDFHIFFNILIFDCKLVNFLSLEFVGKLKKARGSIIILPIKQISNKSFSSSSNIFRPVFCIPCLPSSSIFKVCNCVILRHWSKPALGLCKTKHYLRETLAPSSAFWRNLQRRNFNKLQERNL